MRYYFEIILIVYINTFLILYLVFKSNNSQFKINHVEANFKSRTVQQLWQLCNELTATVKLSTEVETLLDALRTKHVPSPLLAPILQVPQAEFDAFIL